MAVDIIILKKTSWIRTAERNPALEDTHKLQVRTKMQTSELMLQSTFN